ncbi:aldehyde dehydrogenase family protein [Bordetella genomosp. 4]|uniref:Succinate-semialdehyde dehydrogenase n=1 Tax=Bordetella genomosp. 4 TaxID=463044 RepID=A0A261UWA7_9BORD|nr:aldehyde dehydrogenase family protein [Bordetella genomosp. 4]OZI45316.1 succinate-semialdehyde dehydrogenase [Bordetella genomosp. 4]OZI66166.1 succinate-semialdehyde dehydrogenase [Bordetella genomosp. 4]
MASNTHAISLNPATGEQIGAYAFESAADLETVLSQSAKAYTSWRRTPVDARSAALARLGQALRADIDRLAGMITAEMGKPITQARGEITKCAGLCDWYAEHGPAMLASEPTQIENDKARIEYRPLGPILAVMPWNFPIWQVIRSVVPALLAGNTYILKHAPNVMGSAYLLREAFGRADFPQGVFEVVNVQNDLVSQAIADDRIAAITLTGSVRAGSAIGSQAGFALKKCVLELGGSDAFIVLADADLDEAIRAAVVGRFQNTGQVCAAAKRFIVEDSVADAFTEGVVAGTKALVIGDPTDPSTYIGPMARYDLRDELDAQVQRTLSEGAKLLVGGKKIDGPGNYYQPTVLADIVPGMTSFREEIFGPVASIIRASDARNALELANNSQFGLTASVFTKDLAAAQQIAADLEVGGVFINGYSASDVRVGFGGVKKSGFGRELSHFGVREFCNAQTVWFDRK